MNRLLATVAASLVFLCLSHQASALTVFEARDGSLWTIDYDAAGKPICSPVTVKPLPTSGDPTTPTDPDDPGDQDDQWKLKVLSRAAYLDIMPYDDIEKDAFAIGAMFHLISERVPLTGKKRPDGKTDVEYALMTACQSGARAHWSAWRPWCSTMVGGIQSAGVIGNQADTARAIADIARGLGVSSRAETETRIAVLESDRNSLDPDQHDELARLKAINWQWIIEFFITYILPLLLNR